LDFEARKVTFLDFGGTTLSEMHFSADIGRLCPLVCGDSQSQSQCFFKQVDWKMNKRFSFGYPLVDEPIRPRTVRNHRIRVSMPKIGSKPDSFSCVPFDSINLACDEKNPLLKDVYDTLLTQFPMELDLWQFSVKFQGFLLRCYNVYPENKESPDEDDFHFRKTLMQVDIRVKLQRLYESLPVIEAKLPFEQIWISFILFVRRTLIGNLKLSICERYVACVKMPQKTDVEKKLKYSALWNCFKEFFDIAEATAELIVKEMGKVEKKIPAVQIGGIAGGSKFISNGCLFKVSQDSLLPNSKKWLYGEKVSNIELAAKASGQELNGAIRFFNVFQEGTVIVPMQSIVDMNGM
jgi:hypothetical protein